MRTTRAWLMMAVSALALLLQGCDKVPYSYVGNFPGPIPAGLEFEATAVLFAKQTPVAAGRVQVSGQLTPQTPSALPSTLRLFIRQTPSGGGAPVATVTVDLTVRPDGVIPNQLVPTPALTIEAGQELKFVLQPIGAALPFGQMKLKLLYEKA